MEPVEPLYDRIGGGYTSGRRPDLASGAWREAYGYLLEQNELDLGYRVIVAG